MHFHGPQVGGRPQLAALDAESVCNRLSGDAHLTCVNDLAASRARSQLRGRAAASRRRLGASESGWARSERSRQSHSLFDIGTNAIGTQAAGIVLLQGEDGAAQQHAGFGVA